MKKKKLQVFISSTFQDLKEERQAAVEAILSSGNIPAGMELFSAGDESQMKVIKRWIEESDVYLLILGGRYGSIEPDTQKSYTQLEYEYAIQLNKPLFSVVIHNENLESKIKEHGSLVIEQEHPQKLKNFKQIVLNKLVKFYHDKRDIKLAVYETLSDFSHRDELIGWVRADESTDTTSLVNQLGDLTQKNKELEKQLKEYNSNKDIEIGNYTFENLKKILDSKIINIPKEVSGSTKDQKKSLLELFIRYQNNFSIGISNRANVSKMEAFLVANVISTLRIYELAETVKVPNVQWSKFQTSKLGNQFLGMLSLEEVSGN